MKRKLHVFVETEATGYYVGVQRYWRMQDGRTGIKTRYYHTSQERGRMIMHMLIDAGVTINSFEASRFQYRA